MTRAGERFLAAGLLLCALGLMLPWGETAGRWYGGYTYRPGSDEVVWNPAARFEPGRQRTGHLHPTALPAYGLLLGLAVWGVQGRHGDTHAAARKQARRRWRWAALACGLLGLWWLTRLSWSAGALLFLGGLAALALSLAYSPASAWSRSSSKSDGSSSPR